MLSNEEIQKRAERYRQNPIYGTDLNRPMSEVIAELRGRMTVLRGQFGDFKHGFPGWHERVEPVEGLLTCGISALYHVLQELEKFEADSKPPNAEVSGCLRAPMPEDAPRTAAGSPLDRPVGPVTGA
jgi:hypothetical protein